MTIWVLHQGLSAEEEARIQERAMLALPFEGLPDLSKLSAPEQAIQLLKLLHPDDPPETLTRRLDTFWKQYHELHVEDIIAVPLKAAQEVALAEVTGPYGYQVGADGSDIHLIPVKWYAQRLRLHAFSKHKNVFQERGEKMFEVTDPETRIAIRDRLPHAYNRFAKWKWLMILFFLLSLISFFDRKLFGL